jgi:hypothetical protein
MTKYFSRVRASLPVRKPFSIVPAAVLLGFLAGGCGEPSLQELDDPLEVRSESSSLEGDNGFTLNGLSSNGMGTNGMGTNGLGTSGLSISAMNSPTFVDWFNQSPSLADMVMRYVVVCAVAEGSSRIWTNPTTGLQYTWHGKLGLAPGWASGTPPTEVEQQVITACLAAHTNKYGIQVPFSIQGLSATGVQIPVGLLEFLTFARREACFFGNIFRDEGVFAGSDSLWSSTNSSVRACGLEVPGAGDQCAPIHQVEHCSEICTPDPENAFFLSCTHNGKSYRAMTTRIRPLDVFICGDGVCQVSESCGTGLTPNNCMDCGSCL